MKCKLYSIFILASVVITPLLLTDCAARSHTETTVESAPAGSQPVIIENKTTEVHEEHHGLFSIIGDIVALPFRAVGALLSAIF